MVYTIFKPFLDHFSSTPFGKASASIIRRALLRACQITSSATTFKIEQDTDTTSVWSKNRTRSKHNNSRTEATTLQLLVFLLTCCLLLFIVVYCCCFLFNCCLLLRQSLTLAGLSGSPGTWPSPLVSLFGGTFFQLVFLHSFFRQKNHICRQLDPKNDSKIHPKPGPGPIFFDFLHSLFLLPCAVFLMVFTVPTCSKTLKKLDKNTALKTQWKKHDDFLQKTRNLQKTTPNWCPKKWVKVGKMSLWRLWWHLWRLCSFFYSKKVAKVLQKWSQACKSDSKRESKVVKVGAR